MRYLVKPMIVSLDVDGIFYSSALAKIACNSYLSEFFAQIPFFKKMMLGVIEAGEVFLRLRYKINEEMEDVCLHWDIPYIGIITDRSLSGLLNVLREKEQILSKMSFIQVRKTFEITGQNQNVWQTKNVKPDKSVLYRLAEFAEEKRARPQEVLVIDDDRNLRIVAKRHFGFAVYPDDTEDIAEESRVYSFGRNAIAPA